MHGLLTGVVVAGQPDAPPGLAAQLHAVTNSLAQDTNLPAELRRLGRVLNDILAGERNPDLTDLPPELATAVNQVLAALDS